MLDIIDIMWYICYTEIIGNNNTNKNFYASHMCASNVLLCHSSINTGTDSTNYVSVRTKPIMTVDKSQTGKRDLS